MAGNLNDIGMSQRELSQQQLDEDVNRYQFGQNIQDQKLANYMNLIQGNYGGSTTQTASRGGLGLAGNLGQLGGSVAYFQTRQLHELDSGWPIFFENINYV
jgi:hypothetical protein